MDVKVVEMKPAPEVLKLLGHDLRWQLAQALAYSDRRVAELTAITGRPQNLVSYHLRLLRNGGLAHERRSSADARDVYYSLDLDRLRDLYLAGGAALHTALGCLETVESLQNRFTERSPMRILFLCTFNSARSQMAEALTARAGGEGVIVASAGSRPSVVHPLAVQVMAERGIDIGDRRSKHLDEFADRRFDYVITVCDRVREVCPVFPNDTVQLHWSIPDPAAVTGPEETRLKSFRETADRLAGRINHLLLAMHAP